MKTPKIKTSTQVEIKRSEIKFAPYNPRKKSDKVINSLIKNFKSVGFLGGIVWNENTKNLIAGHKRVEALDKIHNYTSSADSDYLIKVEKINIDEKTEKKQNIYMNSDDVQGEYDFEILASLMEEIEWEFEEAGLSQETIDLMIAEVPNYEYNDANEIKSDFIKLSERTDLSEEQIKQKRQEKRQERKIIEQERGEKSMEKPYLIITFRDFETKAFVCEHFKIDQYGKYFSGEDLFKDIL